jgi:transcription-repair coupling factor (superfamily II helicase)
VTASWLRPLAADDRLEPIRQALARAETRHVAGLAGPARYLYPLLVSNRRLLFVVPSERELESAILDLRTLATEIGLDGSVLPFPAPGPSPFRGLPRHAEAVLRRAAALHAAHRGRLRAVVASPSGLLRPTLTRELFETRAISLGLGDEMTPEILLEALDEGGYRREDPVTSPGQMARRGGILDVFPADRDEPVRVEFLGDTIESLRTFDPETQRSREELTDLEVVPLSDLFPTRSTLARLRERLAARFPSARTLPAVLERIDRGIVDDDVAERLPLVEGTTVPAWAHFGETLVVVFEPEQVAAEIDAYYERAHADRKREEDELALEPEEALVPADALRAHLVQGPALHLSEMPLADAPPDLELVARAAPRYAGDVRRLAHDLRAASGRTVIFLGNAGRADRLREVLTEDEIATGEDAAVEIRVGALSRGFELPAAGLTVLADGDVFPEEVHLHARSRGRGVRSFLSDFRDLRLGDLVVHQDHGIGRFEGLETLEIGGARVEFMVLSYAGGDKLKVPIDAFDQLQKYNTTEGAARPAMDRLGSGRWDKVKRRVKKAMRDMAAELLKLYAERKARPGHAFTGESPWLREFEESFEYEETPDQGAAIAEVAWDMSRDVPMDRLICGDVGYGKTEVAMRAAMRAVLDQKQVAVLTPTTVLAFQHWKTFRKRFAPFPVRVEMVSRFRAAKEIKSVLADTAAGKVDILIGTHRLLSKDVTFQDLGLLVIDEEQRFGVAAKERLKQLRRNIDCLTLSATPIPRTLQMGLGGIRDMSVIETPPKDRLAIQTSIVKFSTDTIASAIRQELARDGQVYFVHNRVESIYSVANMVQKLCPEATVVVGHGQMPEAELEKAMLAFVEGRADVLVATTIIENGLDIPRANTMVINRADRYGLAQLYQLRGRVGRSDRRAYAYLLVPPDTVLSEVARKRLAAIRDFSELGAGFRIAALDLELRGAGNLLGGEQSGHIEAVGLDLYVKLLQQTILELKGEAPPDGARVILNLRIDLRIPEEFVPEVQQRMSLYKRISQVRTRDDLERLRAEIADRYGPLPAEVEGLLRYGGLRLRAEALGIAQIDRGPESFHLRFTPEPNRPAEALVRIVRKVAGTTVTPQGVLRIPVPAASADPLTALEAVLTVVGTETAALAATSHL